VRSIDRQYPYQIFNLGKGNGTSLNEFISIVEKHTGRKAMIRQLPDQAGDVPYTCADVTKASILLGYNANVSFDDGIRKTVEWYRNARDEKSNRLPISPETQANGFGRSPSFAEMPVREFSVRIGRK
jgi:UDP-glucuronate 4-epimerase